jgi:DNA-binding winged helix-turn-helix (wHTH) protein
MSWARPMESDDRGTGVIGRAIRLGPFRPWPARQLLLEADIPVRPGARAFDLMPALVEHAGEIVAKDDLIARVWPGPFSR